MTAPLKNHRWIYCVSEGAGMPIKIGVSKNIRSRISSVHCHTWRDVFFHWAVPGCVKSEKLLKQALGPQHLRNEWFSDSQDTVKDAFDSDDWRFGGEPWPVKFAFNKALRKAKLGVPFGYGFRCYYEYQDQLYFRTFNSEFKQEMQELASSLGVEIGDEHFAPRHYSQILGLISSIEKRAAA